MERPEKQASDVLDEIELQCNLLALSAALGAASAAAPEDRLALSTAELQELADRAKRKIPSAPGKSR